MKRLLFLLALSFLLNPAFVKAQYLPLANKGQQWNILERADFNTSYTYLYRVQKDTLINNRTYPLLTQADSSGVPAIPYGILIEDSSAQTLTIDFFDTALTKVFYDFSLMPGDSFHYACPFSADSGSLYLDSITIFIDSMGIARRQFNFSSYNAVMWGDYFHWIEGLGSVENFLLNVPPCLVFKTSPFSKTLCITDSTGIILYDNPNYANCIEHEIGLDEERMPDFSVYPNPAGEILKIDGRTAETEGKSFSIYDFKGELIYFGKVQNGEINISKIPPGFYLIKLQTYPQPLKWKKL